MRHRPLVLAIFLSFVGAAASAEEQKGMPLDHTHYLVSNDPKAPEDPLVKAVDADKLAGGKWSAIAHSRIETELKVSVEDHAQFLSMRKALDILSKDRALAARVLGPGWHLDYTRDRVYSDTYRDDAKRILAQVLAGVRTRLVDGQDLELNVKPAGGLLSGPGGIILTRAELGLLLGPDHDLEAIARSSSHWNPMLQLGELVKDRATLVVPSMQLTTARGRYSLSNSRNAEWKNLVDLSADHVHTIQDVRPGAKPLANVPHIYGLEADLNHPGQQSGMVIDNVAWSAPHRSVDAHRAELHNDAAVKALHEVGPRLLDWMQHEHGVSTKGALPKYTQAALNAGLIKQKQLKLNKSR